MARPLSREPAVSSYCFARERRGETGERGAITRSLADSNRWVTQSTSPAASLDCAAHPTQLSFPRLATSALRRPAVRTPFRPLSPAQPIYAAPSSPASASIDLCSLRNGFAIAETDPASSQPNAKSDLRKIETQLVRASAWSCLSTASPSLTRSEQSVSL